MTGILGRPPPRFEGEIGSRPSRVPSLRDPAIAGRYGRWRAELGRICALFSSFDVGCTYAAYNAWLDNGVILIQIGNLATVSRRHSLRLARRDDFFFGTSLGTCVSVVSTFQSKIVKN